MRCQEHQFDRKDQMEQKSIRFKVEFDKMVVKEGVRKAGYKNRVPIARI